MSIPSDLTAGPVATSIGIMWKRLRDSQQTTEDYRTLWNQMRGLGIFVVAADGAHTTVAFSNVQHRLAAYIESTIGVDPWRDW